MNTTKRSCCSMLLAIFALVSCESKAPTVTSVGKSVATFEKFGGMAGCTAPPAPVPDPQAWWNAMPPANHQYPIAGWETWRNLTGGCLNTRVDVYRAVTTFNLASVANLKGLVQKAELIVSSHALPANQGGTVTVPITGQTGNVVLRCPQNLGGAGHLVRFGPNAVIPPTSAGGSFTMLGADPFPAGNDTVYTMRAIFTPGPIPNATNPSTIAPTGDGRATITTDVTSSVTAALNAGMQSMSWMLTSSFEGDLPGQLPASGTVDCRTAYDFDLRITHL
jgi:hypothetical protein